VERGPPEPVGPAPSRAPRWLWRSAAALAGLYLLGVWLDAAGASFAERALPRPARFFLQVAELFPHAARDAIEWRARGWLCTARRFEEIDVRPLFRIRSGDKENRFGRAMFFYHRERRVMEALDEYITREHNRLHPDERIGGVMLLSLRLPIPPPGQAGSRYVRRPIADYPSTVERRYWYVADTDLRQSRCAEDAGDR